MKILKKEFGGKSIADVLPMHINTFLTRLHTERSSFSKLNKCRTMLIQIFEAAEVNALIVRNPARHSKQIKGRTGLSLEKDKKKDSFSPEEIDTLMEQLPHNMTGNSIRLLLGAGLRVQELLALTKDDISEDGSWIQINKAVKTVDGKSLLGPPKNNTSNRTVPIPVDYRQYALYVCEHGSRPFLWKSSKPGIPYGVSSFRKVFKSALEGIDGVRKLSPHCCRHTYITQLQAKGVSMENIARLAGHTRISTTDGYLHVSLETLGNAVNALNMGKPAP